MLEVGPGTGALTEALLERGCRVVAVELDAGLAAMLRERQGELAARYPGSELQVIEGDCLDGPGGRRVNPAAIAALGAGEFALIANLPYGAATPLMLGLLIHHPACTRMAVTIQREVAERLLAKSGTKTYGTLGVVAQAMAEIRHVADLPPECFWPRPEVHSAMVVLERRAKPLANDPEALTVMCQRLFGQRRKQLGSILGRDFAWPAGIDAGARPEQLSVAELVELVNVRRLES